MYKKCSVVLLPTNQEAKVGNIVKSKFNDIHILTRNDSKQYAETTTVQYLYIISDEKIKKGDWFIANQAPRQCIKINDDPKYPYQEENGDCHFHTWSGVIIASTDPSLTIYSAYIGSVGYLGLPQPSLQFIQKFIEQWNKGNKIEEVMVEYNVLNKGYNTVKDIPYEECNRLKVNSKDNTITIKKLKDSYSREETIDLCERAWQAALNKQNDRFNSPGFTLFIQQNL